MRYPAPEELVAVLWTACACVGLLHTLSAAPPSQLQPDQRPPRWTLPELRGEVLLSTTQHCIVMLLCKVATEKLLVASNLL